jgi:hypothetical protein
MVIEVQEAADALAADAEPKAKARPTLPISFSFAPPGPPRP